jgi:hypothetical protein
MEKLVTNELSWALILTGVGAAAISAFFVKMVSTIRGAWKPYQRKTILYAFMILLSFSALGCVGYFSTFGDHLLFFIFFQFCFLFLGIGHLFWMRTWLKWSGGHGSATLELPFTLAVAMFGSIAFSILFRLFDRSGLEYDMTSSTLFFFIPWVVAATFAAAVAIPAKDLRQWRYPVGVEIKDPEDEKLKNLLVISFEFKKQTTDELSTNFRAKAPVDMDMGDLFYYFVNDYNDRHPNGPIQFIDALGTPYGWVFYRKPQWYLLFRRYIDTSKSVFNNHIRENDVIICSRELN